MNFEKDDFRFGHFTGRIHNNFGFKEEFFKNKKAKKHFKTLLDIAEVEVEKEIDKRFTHVRKHVKRRIEHFRKIFAD